MLHRRHIFMVAAALVAAGAFAWITTPVKQGPLPPKTDARLKEDMERPVTGSRSDDPPLVLAPPPPDLTQQQYQLDNMRAAAAWQSYQLRQQQERTEQIQREQNAKIENLQRQRDIDYLFSPTR
jgi:hypothetical protein